MDTNSAKKKIKSFSISYTYPCCDDKETEEKDQVWTQQKQQNQIKSYTSNLQIQQYCSYK